MGTVYFRRSAWRWLAVGIMLAFCTPAFGQTNVANYQFTAGWATFGLPLAQGVATGLKIGNLPTQVDVKRTYPDGSIRFAVLTAKIPSSGTYAIVTAAPSSGSVAAPTWPNVSVQMRVWPAGTTYTATLPAAQMSDSWLSGPLVQEARVRVTPAASGSPHPFLRVLFDVRSYNDGTHRVDVIGENTLVQNSTTDRVDYDLTVTINGNTVYSRSTVTGSGTLTSTDQYKVITTSAHSLSKGEVVELTSGPQSGEARVVGAVYNANTYFVSWPFSAAQSNVTWKRVAVRHWAGSRWRKTFPVGLTEASITPDTSVFAKAHALPDYLTSLPADASYPDRGPNPYEPMNIGAVMIPNNSAGGRAEIGPYPQWTARYMAHPTSDLRSVVVGEGVASGTFPIHWSDSDVKQLISLNDHPTFWRSLGNGGKGMGKSDDGAVDHFQVDTPHVPSLAFAPYLLTGDRYFLDEMRFWANWSLLCTYTQGPTPGAGSRGDAYGFLGVMFNAPRGWGWALRNLADVAAWAPDGDPYKSYFETILVNNLRTADSYATQHSQSPYDGVLDSLDGYNPNYPDGSDAYPKYVVVVPWMNAYLGWAIDHAMSLGYTDGGVMRTKLARMALNVYNSPGVAPGERAPYRLFTAYLASAGATPAYYPTVDAAYAAMRAAPGGPDLMSPYLGDYYGTEMRLLYQIGNRLGLTNAGAALRWIESFVDPLGQSFAQRVNERSQFGLADTPGQSLLYKGKPAAPSNLHISR